MPTLKRIQPKAPYFPRTSPLWTLSDVQKAAANAQCEPTIVEPLVKVLRTYWSSYELVHARVSNTDLRREFQKIQAAIESLDLILENISERAFLRSGPKETRLLRDVLSQHLIQIKTVNAAVPRGKEPKPPTEYPLHNLIFSIHKILISGKTLKKKNTAPIIHELLRPLLKNIAKHHVPQPDSIYTLLKNKQPKRLTYIPKNK